MHYFHKNRESGFTLVELLIAMTIGLIILTALSSTFLMQRKIYDVQEQIVEMVQTARAAMDMMTREIRMAGYDPTGLANAGIVSATSNSINFTLDITDDAGTGPPDGDTGDSNENITYSLYTPADGIQKLGRKSTSTAVNQPVAENIENLQISQSGNSINVSLTARTSKADSDYSTNNGYRTHTLTSLITPRNLAF
ncbi:MAG: prepilin-type N-terminal cleavage/methylation domain-containing protein [Spirochaetales bacterium]|nr:prepilin-type N-terminal cleavage/methylation domain-containing protein [Spirochaetales bacterium]